MSTQPATTNPTVDRTAPVQSPVEIPFPRAEPSGFWRQPSTQWDITKVALGLAVTFGGFTLGLYVTQTSLVRDNTDIRQTIAKWQDVKEDRTAKMGVLELQVVKTLPDQIKALAEQERKDNDDIKGEIRDLRNDLKSLFGKK